MLLQSHVTSFRSMWKMSGNILVTLMLEATVRYIRKTRGTSSPSGEDINAGRDQPVSSIHKYIERDIIAELLCLHSHLRADQFCKNIWH